MIEYISKGKARFRVSTGSGKDRKRYTKTVSYKSKKELKRMHDSFEDEMRHNLLTKTTVGELVSSYIEHCKIIGVKATTIHGYRIAEKRVNSRFERVLASSLTTYQLEDFVVEMANKPLAPKTIRNTVSLLSSAYERAVRLGQLSQNPCLKVSMPKADKREIVTLSEKELLRFCESLEKQTLDYRVGYKLCLFCGLRRSEVLGLKESDINIPFRSVTIERTRHIVDGEEVIQPPKTKQSARVLALPSAIIDEINELIASHRESEYCSSDYLIQDGFGQPLNPSTFSSHIYLIEKDADLPMVSVHGLRHTFASLLNASGIDIARISRELGHSNINTTLGIYTHVFGNVTVSSRGIADAVDSKLKNSATILPQIAK